MIQNKKTGGRQGRRTGGSRGSRRGATIVELSLVLPLIFFLVFASIEFGRLMMALHGMEEASREGCRFAVEANTTTSQIEAVVANRLGTFGIAGQSVSIVPDPAGISCQWDPITVSVSVTYDNVSWLPVPDFLQGITLTETCTLPREAEGCN